MSTNRRAIGILFLGRRGGLFLSRRAGAEEGEGARFPDTDGVHVFEGTLEVVAAVAAGGATGGGA